VQKSLMIKSAQTILGGMKKSSMIKVPKQHWGYERKSSMIKSAQTKQGGMKESQKDLSVPQQLLIK
jgi:hypothetical protein